MLIRYRATRCFWIFTFAICSVRLNSAAAETQPPNLDEILLRLQDNLDHYQKDVPNFFCTENVKSALTYAKTEQAHFTDAIFRVMRTSSGMLSESHEVQAVNGVPAKGDQIRGPTTVSGVFTGSLNVVSVSQRACMRYTLQPIDPHHRSQPYIIQFATVPNNQHEGCLLKEEADGRVLIDPATFQVSKLELRAPNHQINPSEVGTWRIAIDYAPVSLAGKTFWMPSAVNSTATSERFTRLPVIYSFTAKYADYHKLEVTSHIVPAQ